MADDWNWENNGSCQDLSDLARNSMWPTSQAGGNMMSSNAQAMTAPGSEPVDPLPDRAHQGEPDLELPEPEPAGDDGKPAATAGQLNQGRPAWGKTTRPDVVRRKQGG